MDVEEIERTVSDLSERQFIIAAKKSYIGIS